jgi:hypothetical protein
VDQFTMQILAFLTNDPPFLQMVREITGCAEIDVFDGRVYRMDPALPVRDSAGEVRAVVGIALALDNPGLQVTIIEPVPDNCDLIERNIEANGVGDRVTFEVASAQTFEGHGYDLAATFDSLHDMGDPLGAARHIRQAVAADGTWLIVEPAASDKLEDNFNPVGRVYYNFSTFLCVPNAMSQTGGYALGAQAGEAAIRQVVTDAFRRAEIPGVGALDGIETHDCFSMSEYMAIDHFGITEPGESWKAVENGELERDGAIPVNPSGGLIGVGHPVGATGVRMVLDAARQVTGQAGECQVERARTFATLNIGGSLTTTVSFVVTAEE